MKGNGFCGVFHHYSCCSLLLVVTVKTKPKYLEPDSGSRTTGGVEVWNSRPQTYVHQSHEVVQFNSNPVRILMLASSLDLLRREIMSLDLRRTFLFLVWSQTRPLPRRRPVGTTTFHTVIGKKNKPLVPHKNSINTNINSNQYNINYELLLKKIALYQDMFDISTSWL